MAVRRATPIPAASRASCVYAGPDVRLVTVKPAVPSVLMVVSEALPYSKTGGLGDVGGALPSALARLGCAVTVVTPRYRGVDDGDEVVRFSAEA